VHDAALIVRKAYSYAEILEKRLIAGKENLSFQGKFYIINDLKPSDAAEQLSMINYGIFC
jgi:hypothetical protein